MQPADSPVLAWSAVRAVGRAVDSAGAGCETRPPSRDRQVVIYVVLALVALVPGLIGALHGPLPDTTAVGAWHAWLIGELEDIEFGSGLRFWLGVTGASMISFLLLYPLRKVFAQRFRLGAVGGWFHIHILFGLFGPVLILYHCNFGPGGNNANVALVTMLIVAVSGVVGHFVYMRVSAGFYGDKQEARGHLDNFIACLRRLEGLDAQRSALIQSIEAFEARLLQPQRGIVASVQGRLLVEVHRRRFLRAAGWLVDEIAREQRWPEAQCHHVRQVMGTPLATYFSTARRAAGRSIREQLWARWRLFHLPIFLIMVAAAVLHVIAVWNMDAPVRQAASAKAANAGSGDHGSAGGGAPAAATLASRDGNGDARARPAAEPRPTAADKASIKPVVTGEQPRPVDRRAPAAMQGPDLRAPAAAFPTAASPAALAPAPDVAVVKVKPVEITRRPPDEAPEIAVVKVRPVEIVRRGPGEPLQVLPGRSPSAPASPARVSGEVPAAALPTAATAGPTPVPAPLPAARLAESASVPKPKVEAAATRPAPAPAASSRTTTPPPVKAAPPSPPVVLAETRSAADAKAAEVNAELRRRVEAPPMALGASKAMPLAARIAELKNRVPRFDHNKETKFPMTGKHVNLECEACHKKTLENTPKECIACHRKDDVHRGRRPNCAECHTTNVWDQLIKKK